MQKYEEFGEWQIFFPLFYLLGEKEAGVREWHTWGGFTYAGLAGDGSWARVSSLILIYPVAGGGKIIQNERKNDEKSKNKTTKPLQKREGLFSVDLVYVT